MTTSYSYLKNQNTHSKTTSRDSSVERDVRFSGYGDRVGSGVELAPSRWTGGEVVTDPTIVAKALNTVKPKRFFYSPIGDGVVAADGVELKRGPVDLTPKVEIIQQRVVERGDGGQAGRRVVEHQWSSGGGGGGIASSNNSTTLNTLGSPNPLGNAANAESTAPSKPATSAVNARTAPAQPPALSVDLQSPFGSLSDPLGLGAEKPKSATPQLASPLSSNYSTLNSRDLNPPYSPYDSLNRGDPLNSHGANDYPPSGRTSTTSALFSEPGMRYEIKKDYKVTNPRELIHQYATTTPIRTIPGYESLPDGGTTTQVIKKSYSRIEESYSPFPPYAASANSVNPNKFVRQLRDETMTVRQRQANQNTQPLNVKDSLYDQRIGEIRRQTNAASAGVDQLTSQLISGLNFKN